jgi:hypothetical protein
MYAFPTHEHQTFSNALAGLQMLAPMEKPHWGGFWPPIKFFLELAKLETARLKYVAEFVDELVELGILRRKRDVALDSTTREH